MFDLIYGGEEYKEELIKLFPIAIIEDTSDEIHIGRISLLVDIPDKVYLKKILINGFAKMSFHLMMIAMNPEKEITKEWNQIVKEVQQEHPEVFKNYRKGKDKLGINKKV